MEEQHKSFWGLEQGVCDPSKPHDFKAHKIRVNTLDLFSLAITSTLEIIVFRFLHAQGGNPNAYQLGGARHLLV